MSSWLSELKVKDGELPAGWEQVNDKDFGTYWIDNNSEETYCVAPWMVSNEAAYEKNCSLLKEQRAAASAIEEMKSASLQGLNCESTHGRLKEICKIELERKLSELDISNMSRSEWHSFYIEEQELINSMAAVNERDLYNLRDFIEATANIEDFRRNEAAVNYLLDVLSLEERLIQLLHITLSHFGLMVNFVKAQKDKESLASFKSAVASKQVRELPDWIKMLKEKDSILRGIEQDSASQRQSQKDEISTPQPIRVQ